MQLWEDNLHHLPALLLFAKLINEDIIEGSYKNPTAPTPLRQQIGGSATSSKLISKAMFEIINRLENTEELNEQISGELEMLYYSLEVYL